VKEVIDRVLFTPEDIEFKVNELGSQITADYYGKEITMVGILSGAIIFMADLARVIELPVSFDFIDVSSYGKSSQTSGVVRIQKDLEKSVGDKDLLIVEDIVDTGLTLKYLLNNLESRDPLTIKVCALLNKPDRRKVEVPIDYCGFDIPDEFVCGYGLDYAGKYRNYPYVFVLKSEIYS